MANYFTTTVEFKASRKSVFESATQSTFFKGFKLSLINDESFEMTDEFPWPRKSDFPGIEKSIREEAEIKGWEITSIKFVPVQLGMSEAEELAQHTYAV